ncbi:hypothetical protein V6N13_132297 [Hibiscus sabdariffa]|uniref:Uncharacterized protein n=1 Tax=Hibiscus sabdariffa TaxID=183260 RepID=A0ABR2PUV1_9ROSI
MSSQNQGVSLSSAAEPPMRRKRGRPRKDEIVQGDNSPVTPASEILNKNKLSVETSDSASDDMVGQMVSGVIEGSFDAGYLLNVKVGETNTHLRGVVFLPGRFTPVTAANDVAPQAKMHKRKEIPFPFVGPQGHLHPLSPTSGKNEKPIEHKNDTPKLQDKGLHIGLQSGATAANESQSASSLIPPASNLPVNDSGLPLGQKVLQDLIVDIGLQNGKAVGFEAFKSMKGPTFNVDAPKLSESVPAAFMASLPVTETVNLKPQVEHQAVSSDLKSQKLGGDVKSLDLVNDQKPKFPDPEPQEMPCEQSGINMFGKQASKFLEPQAMSCEPTGINMFGKQASKFPEPEPQAMLCEPTGINMFGNQASKFSEPKSQHMPCEPPGINMFGKQASKFPGLEPQAIPCEPAGINMFGKQASKFLEPELQARPCESAGVNMFGKQASKFPEPEHQAMPCEPAGINMFGKQASKFPEPETQVMPCEPAGINMFKNQASIFPGPESQAMSCEPAGINMFGKQASTFPEPESQAMTYELAGINMFGKQSSKFPEPEPQGIRCELTGMNMFGKQASKFPEPQAMPCESTGNNIFWKQASTFPESDSQAISCEPTGLNMFGKQTSSRQGIDVSQDTQLELANKIMTGADVPHSDGLFTSDVATTTATAPCSATMTSLPIMIFGAETMSFGHKPASEESVLPRMILPEFSSSSTAVNTNSVESDTKDTFPPS